MGSIRVQKLTKSFGIHTIFRNVSFELRRGERIGLIGANGVGKSTLLKCLMGQEEYDAGAFVISEGETIGYLQQNITFDTAVTLRQTITEAWQDVLRCEIQLKETEQAMQHEPDSQELMNRYSRLQERFEWLGGYEYEAMSRKIIHGLGFAEADMDRLVQSFSGGQKTRINLAKALVCRPDYLFLDEPTNHLDMEMLEWLESYLLSYGGGILIVSHDRYFLDRVTTSILEMENGTITKYKGNYSRYIQQREQRRKAMENAYEKQQEQIKETEEYIRKYKAGIKSKQARGRQSQLDRLERIEFTSERDSLHFAFKPVEECGQKVLVLDDICGGYGDKQLFNHLSLLLRRGESAALIGPNGTGKTTLFQMIMGKKTFDSGHITLGSRVHVGYFAQEHTELHGTWSVMEEIMNEFSYSEEDARAVLGSFLFRGDDVYKRIDTLSGGEQARLALLELFLHGPNFLILDEPTNHLDIPTREILEQALLDFGGTYLVVSHDRYFLDKIAGRMLVLENKKLKEYLGNYTYYREKEQEKEELAAQELLEKADSVQKKEDIFLSAEKDKKIRVKKSNVESTVRKTSLYGAAKKLENIEMKIAEWEATLKMYDFQMNLPENQTNAETMMALTEQYEETQKKLDKAYEKWETLSE
ncbi:MAG: ABC-F family ATP-binding cassette domain-containing protein [Megasphaera sp.]|uniref:ABC-F family ATP-binding cassette domain-containing protein n=1 Tax=Megasphaera sueciensis TaxID=349094 RepID=UPI003CFCAF39|nr:ABC-F family ATP-binding cassette domain-containing protein [Megasphaera sp.]